MCRRAGIGFSYAGAGSVRNEFLKIVRDAGRAGAGPAHISRVFCKISIFLDRVF